MASAQELVSKGGDHLHDTIKFILVTLVDELDFDIRLISSDNFWLINDRVILLPESGVLARIELDVEVVVCAPAANVLQVRVHLNCQRISNAFVELQHVFEHKAWRESCLELSLYHLEGW